MRDLLTQGAILIKKAKKSSKTKQHIPSNATKRPLCCIQGDYKKFLNAKNNAPNQLSLSTHYVLIHIDYFVELSQYIKCKLL